MELWRWDMIDWGGWLIGKPGRPYFSGFLPGIADPLSGLSVRHDLLNLDRPHCLPLALGVGLVLGSSFAGY